MSLDQIDTPSPIAQKMVDCLSRREQGIVADFAAGGGALLSCAARRWQTSKILGVDVSKKRVNVLRKLQPGWHLGSADFINPRSRSHCRVLSGLEGKISLILLNPPFSCRGSKTLRVSVAGRIFSCSLAVAFMLASIPYLSGDGEIVAILPSGVFYGERDCDALRHIENKFNLEFIDKCDHRTFDGVTVRTDIVRLARRRGLSLVNQRNAVASALQPLQGSLHLVRGGFPMHVARSFAEPGQIPLIHTTELSDNMLRPSKLLVGEERAIRGPMILLPRVGQPNARKLVLVRHSGLVTLSDCVIAIRVLDGGRPEVVYAKLLENWRLIESLYGGTCALYVTKQRLVGCLEGMGYRVLYGKENVDCDTSMILNSISN